VKKLFSLEWSDFREYVANLTAASTGLRQSELLGLQRKNIKGGYLEILKSWEQVTRELNQTTKTGRKRFCPIPVKIETAIHTLMNSSPWKTPESFIFFSTDRLNKPIEGRALTKGFYKALLRIGIDREQRKKRNIDFHSW
jgi:integrase